MQVKKHHALNLEYNLELRMRLLVHMDEGSSSRQAFCSLRGQSDAFGEVHKKDMSTVPFPIHVPQQLVLRGIGPLMLEVEE